MKKVCAWCQRTIGDSVAAPEGEVALVSHGICPECSRAVRMELLALPPLRQWANEHALAKTAV